MATAIQALQQQRLLLQMEYAAEKDAFRKQTEEMGLMRCLVPPEDGQELL